jgi:hypothetical protein
MMSQLQTLLQPHQHTYMDREFSRVATSLLPSVIPRSDTIAMLQFENSTLTMHDYGLAAAAMPTLTKARRAPSKDPAEWERFKDDIERLYIAQNLSLGDVKQRMALVHGFRAT